MNHPSFYLLYSSSPVCRAKFAIDRLSQASLMGYSDCSLELSKAHEYLAKIYAEDMALKQESLG